MTGYMYGSIGGGRFRTRVYYKDVDRVDIIYSPCPPEIYGNVLNIYIPGATDYVIQLNYAKEYTVNER